MYLQNSKGKIFFKSRDQIYSIKMKKTFQKCFIDIFSFITSTCIALAIRTLSNLCCKSKILNTEEKVNNSVKNDTVKKNEDLTKHF